MNRQTTITFTKTMAVLNRADSLMPMTRMTVTNNVISTAGKLITAPVDVKACVVSFQENGACVHVSGSWMPSSSCRNATT